MNGGECQVHVFIEKIEVQKYKNKKFVEILQLIICYYYTLNIMYPAELSQTMEFLVRY